MKYNIRSIFLKKAYTKCGRETGPRSLAEKSQLSISLDQQSAIIQFVSIVYPVLLTSRFYLIQSFFKKHEKGLELVSLSHFMH